MTSFLFGTFTSDEEVGDDDDGTKYRHRDNLKGEGKVKRRRRCVMHVSDGPGWISKPRSCTHTLTPFSIHLPPAAQVHHRHSRLSHLAFEALSSSDCHLILSLTGFSNISTKAAKNCRYSPNSAKSCLNVVLAAKNRKRKGLNG